MRRALRDLLLRCDVLVQRYSASYELHPYLQRAMSTLGVSVVLDVGANRGQFGDCLRRHGYTGTILSFEPHPAALAELRAKADADPAWQVEPIALGSEAGTADLVVYSERGDLNSFHAPTSQGAAMWEGAMLGAPTVSVPVGRLDDSWALDHRRLLVKLDTQGHDLEVAKGGEATIGAAVIVVTEVAISHLYEGAPDFSESLSYFGDRGFELAGLHPVLRAEDGIRLVEADAVFVRK